MRAVGVDLGIRKVAYSVWDDGVLIDTQAYEASSALSRPQELEDVADFMYCEMEAVRPDVVMIEETLIGNNRKYSIRLAQTMGAVLLRLQELSHLRSFEILPVNVTVWKKAVTGKGNADKQAIQDYLYDYNSAYAELCGDNQDRFDAACIGYYASILHERVEG